MSTLTVATVKSNTSDPPAFQNTSGTEIGRLCRAFVNFDASNSGAIRAGHNVSSITINGTGDFTVNFATAMPDSNYTPVITFGTVTGADYWGFNGHTSTTTSGYRFRTRDIANGALNPPLCAVAIFR